MRRLRRKGALGLKTFIMIISALGSPLLDINLQDQLSRLEAACIHRKPLVLIRSFVSLVGERLALFEDKNKPKIK